MDQALQKDITERSFRFALMIIELIKGLPSTSVGVTIGKQVLRSGTSVGANIEEAEAASSRADFTHRMSIALREARETHYWLRLLKDSKSVSSEIVSPVIQEADELKRILGAIISSTKGTRKTTSK